MKKSSPSRPRLIRGFNPVGRMVPSKKRGCRRTLEKKWAKKEILDA